MHIEGANLGGVGRGIEQAAVATGGIVVSA